jgi:hypothetical protein
MMKTEFHASLDWSSDKIELYGRQTDYQGNRYVYLPGLMEKVVSQNSVSRSDPVLSLDPDGAQKLMDALYNAGIRPSKEFGQSSQMDSMKYHLEDMRRLVFKDKR